MTPMRTTEDFKKEVFDVNPNFEILSEYNGLRKKITRKCKVCGDVREVQARMLLDNRGCQACVASKRGAEKRKSPIQFSTELFEVNPNIELLSEYTTNNARVHCRCKLDGHEWNGIPHTLLDGHGCPECYRRIANRRTEDEFLKEMRERFPTIHVLSKYVRVAVKVDFACDVCGYHWTAIPDTILNNKNSGCPKCAGRAHILESEMIERLRTVSPSVEYLSGYKNILSHANFKCKKCGYKWSAAVNSVLGGHGCPKCCSSHGEEKVCNYLDSHGIDYIREYRFKDCKNERQLPFDFYIPSKNTCIEYDGQQHFMPVRFSKSVTESDSISTYKSQQKKDSLKTEYCNRNGIKLIRIPYTDFDNVENILDKHFS